VVRTSLKVALVCPYSLSAPGGVQGQVLGLARALERRGHEPVVFAPVDGPGPEDVRVVSTGLSVSVPGNGSVAPLARSFGQVRTGARSIATGGFDIVHVHEPLAPGLPLALVLSRRVPPAVATFHRSGASAAYRLLRPLGGLVARRFAVRVAVSEAARATAQVLVPGPVQVLFNGVVTGDQVAEPWPTTGPTVLFLGRHEARKGLAVLLAAHERLAVPRPVLWIAGAGPETTALQQRYPATPERWWLGVVDDAEKDRRLAAADVLAAPSLGGESFGIVLLEAMAHGTAVVASDIDGYRQAAGGAARLVPPGDAVALSDALGEVLGCTTGEKPETTAALVARGRERADACSMTSLAERYENLYRTALDAAGR
jgi:phosphatidylinositol alpha-mannosyltransferase